MRRIDFEQPQHRRHDVELARRRRDHLAAAVLAEQPRRIEQQRHVVKQQVGLRQLRLGVEEPSVVTLLHRLEREGWVTRENSPHDRRCNMVRLGRRAQRIIAPIKMAANELRHELLADIPASELRTCIKVLTRIYEKAEGRDEARRIATSFVRLRHNGQKGVGRPIVNKRALRGATRRSK